ncbi:MAG: hypothetical protein ACI89U_001035 [Gammaproteobacteria bacterium]|jgi:hypothetical protein
MVDYPADVCWSSCQCHTTGVESSLHSLHKEYLKLSQNKLQRLSNRLLMKLYRLQGVEHGPRTATLLPSVLSYSISTVKLNYE